MKLSSLYFFLERLLSNNFWKNVLNVSKIFSKCVLWKIYMLCVLFFFVESKYLAKFLLWPLLSYSYEPLGKIVIVTWFRYDQVLQLSFIIKCPQMIINNLKPICVTILWSESPGWAEVLLKYRLLRLIQHTICVAWGSQAGSCNPEWKQKLFFFIIYAYFKSTLVLTLELWGHPCVWGPPGLWVSQGQSFP